jgi:hypothetical protein
MKITIGDTVLKDGEIIKVIGKEKKYKPTVISDTIPMFIQDEDGMWVKNPDYEECDN